MDFSPLNRRRLIQYGGGFVGAGLMATVLGQNLAHPPVVQAQTPSNRNLSPD